MIKLHRNQRLTFRFLFLILIVNMLFNPTLIFGNPYNKFKKSFQPIDNHIKQLFEKTVKLYLQDDLWEKGLDYDAGHALMVPLHAAFILNINDWRLQFEKHFKRFMEQDRRTFLDLHEEDDLARLHYLYLISRFVALKSDRLQKNENISATLVARLYKDVEILWTKKEAWWYGGRRFKGGIRERLEWKLNVKNVKYSYYRAIIDHDLFLFAIAADLRIYEINRVPKRSWSPIISDILNKAFETIQSRMLFTETGGCLFEPGAWRDHRDYNYVGNAQILPDLPVKKITDISEDSSHSHRWPLWLTSLQDASINDQKKYEYYGKVIKALEKQFYEHALVLPTASFAGLRLNNFMDGRNGVYRYGYITQGKGRGYGPYQLSGILPVGWWGFLISERINKAWKIMSGLFPLKDNVLLTYVGPNTTRIRHPLVTWPQFFLNGFAELNVRLICKIQDRLLSER